MAKSTKDDNFTLDIGGTPRTIKMSYGLLNELARAYGGLDGIAEISEAPELRNEVLIQLLSTRDERGNITEPVNLFLLEADADDIISLIEWSGVHVADFLLKQLIKTKGIMDSHQETMKALMPT